MTQETKYNELLVAAHMRYINLKVEKGFKPDPYMPPEMLGIQSDQVKAVLWVVAGELVKHG
jgi:hypothetical protein